MPQLAAKTKDEQDPSVKFGSGSIVDRDKVDIASEPKISTPRLRRQSRVKVKSEKLIMLTTQLSIMLDSGVVLSDALDAITEQTEAGVFKTLVIDISERIKSGETFSDTLRSYPRVFNPMFVSMVKASEASGKMSEMLDILCGYLTFEDETRKRIKGALTYPVIMCVMAVAAMAIMMLFVLPKFTALYETRGASLPALTQMLVDLSEMLRNWRALTINLTGLVLFSVGTFFWSKTLSGRRILDFLKLRTPVIGTMLVDTVITRSMRIMATMINTGVSLLDTLEVIQESCDNYYFNRLWVDTESKIRDGYQLTEAMQISADNKLIAPGIIQMLRAGEKAGKIGEISDKVSIFYAKKLEISIKSVTALIEPLMITFLGIVIGTISIALLLPVFKISSVISQ